jgi:hypothetical protein
MKTTNLNYADAVRAMVEGRCERIEHPSIGFVHLKDGHVVLKFTGAQVRAKYITDDRWSLVNPVIPTEEREVKPVWTLVNRTTGESCGDLFTTKVDAIANEANGFIAVLLTGKYSAPVPPKEKKRVEGHVVWKYVKNMGYYPANTGESEFIGWETLAGKTGRLTFEED